MSKGENKEGFPDHEELSLYGSEGMKVRTTLQSREMVRLYVLADTAELLSESAPKPHL